MTHAASELTQRLESGHTTIDSNERIAVALEAILELLTRKFKLDEEFESFVQTIAGVNPQESTYVRRFEDYRWNDDDRIEILVNGAWELATRLEQDEVRAIVKRRSNR